jgi:hypothetical protein
LAELAGLRSQFESLEIEFLEKIESLEFFKDSSFKDFVFKDSINRLLENKLLGK